MPPHYSTEPHDEHLLPGRTYRVIRQFEDFDGCAHPVGEAWQLLGWNYFPYDAGLSLYVRFDDGREEHFRMQCLAEAQGPITDSWYAYLQEREDRHAGNR